MKELTIEHSQSLEAVPIEDVEIGARYRKEFGEIEELAENIREFGQLVPILITENYELVDGQRRIMALNFLGWKTIICRKVSIKRLVGGEYSANYFRKDFTHSERVAIGKAVEREIGNRQGERTDINPTCGQLATSQKGQKTREVAAEKAGYDSEQSYRRAKNVIDNGIPDVAEAMDKGEISVSKAAEIAKKPKEEQKKAVESATGKKGNSKVSNNGKKSDGESVYDKIVKHSTKSGEWCESDRFAEETDSNQKTVTNAIGQMMKLQGIAGEKKFVGTDDNGRERYAYKFRYIGSNVGRGELSKMIAELDEQRKYLTHLVSMHRADQSPADIKNEWVKINKALDAISSAAKAFEELKK